MGAAFSLDVPEISLAPLPEGEGRKHCGQVLYITKLLTGMDLGFYRQLSGWAEYPKAAGAEILQGEERLAPIDSAFHVSGSCDAQDATTKIPNYPICLLLTAASVVVLPGVLRPGRRLLLNLRAHTAQGTRAIVV
jgi:hypothetical protein